MKMGRDKLQKRLEIGFERCIEEFLVQFEKHKNYTQDICACNLIPYNHVGHLSI